MHPAPVRPQAAAREVRDVGAVEPDRPRRRLEQPVDAVADRRLPAAGLADEAEHLARADRERHAVDRVHDAAAVGSRHGRREVLDEPVDLEDRLRSVAHRSTRMEARDERGRAEPRAAPAPPTSDCSSARGHRSAKAQWPGSSASDGTRPGISCSRPFRAAPGRGTAPSSPIVYGCCGCAKSSSHRRLLRLPAGVHHHDPVGEVGDDAEVVRDQDDRRAEPLAELAQEVEDPRLDRHVERGRRLVGDQDLRIARERHRDHHPLAHPAGELVRVLVDPAARVAGCGRGRGARAPALGRRAWRRPMCSLTTSSIWRPIRNTGFRDVIGSWKTNEICRPRTFRRLRPRALRAARRSVEVDAVRRRSRSRAAARGSRAP